MDGKKIAQAALAATIAIGLSGIATQAVAAKKMEKCYGVVKKAKNDCGSAKHACAAQGKVDGDASEWVYLPTGTCDKLVNGSTKSGK